MYLTIAAIASLLVMAFNVNTNSMNVNALDLGLISKDNNVGSIDSENLFNCFGVAVACDNDNTVNNNIAINKGTSGPVDSACERCLETLNAEQLSALKQSIFIEPEATLAETCEALFAFINANPDNSDEIFFHIVGVEAFTVAEATELFECLGIPVPN